MSFIKKIVNIIDKYNARLFDIFFTGPIRLYISKFITNKKLKIYLFIEGSFVILFNLYPAFIISCFIIIYHFFCSKSVHHN